MIVLSVNFSTMNKTKLPTELTNLKSSLFITGTDTGVGKSIITAFLALCFLEQGKRVAISKPLQTGHPRDTDFLSTLTGGKIPIFNTYTFELPSAPSVASEYENKQIDISKIIFDIKELEKKYDLVIVEGIGGIAVPIKDTYLVSDLIRDLDCKTIIVARPSLGTINHTVLTIDFAKHNGINLLGFITSGYDESVNDPVIETAPTVISKITQINCLFRFPVLPEVSGEEISKIVRSCIMLEDKIVA